MYKFNVNIFAKNIVSPLLHSFQPKQKNITQSSAYSGKEKYCSVK